MYKKAEASFWTAEEIDLSADAVDWEQVSTTEQHFISHVLAFFAASDGIVNENLSGNFATEITLPEIICSAVEIEMEFAVDALPVELIGINSCMMCDYIKFCANRLLLSLGCDRHYRIGNPFEWMETFSLQGKTNFFEKRVGEYFKSGVGVDRADQSFALDASF